MNPNIIRTISHVDIEEWTWENFTRYVEYESMFFGTAERIDPHTAPCASGERSTAAAVFVLHRSNQGYNGFILSHREYIHLFNPDSMIPLMTYCKLCDEGKHDECRSIGNHCCCGGR
jgi:hypothetical protein